MEFVKVESIYKLVQASSLCNYVQMELDRKDIANMKINLVKYLQVALK